MSEGPGRGGGGRYMRPRGPEGRGGGVRGRGAGGMDHHGPPPFPHPHGVEFRANHGPPPPNQGPHPYHHGPPRGERPPGPHEYYHGGHEPVYPPPRGGPRMPHINESFRPAEGMEDHHYEYAPDWGAPKPRYPMHPHHAPAHPGGPAEVPPISGASSTAKSSYDKRFSSSTVSAASMEPVAVSTASVATKGGKGALGVGSAVTKQNGHPSAGQPQTSVSSSQSSTSVMSGYTRNPPPGEPYKADPRMPGAAAGVPPGYDKYPPYEGRGDAYNPGGDWNQYGRGPGYGGAYSESDPGKRFERPPFSGGGATVISSSTDTRGSGDRPAGSAPDAPQTSGPWINDKGRGRPGPWSDRGRGGHRPPGPGHMDGPPMHGPGAWDPGMSAPPIPPPPCPPHWLNDEMRFGAPRGGPPPPDRGWGADRGGRIRFVGRDQRPPGPGGFPAPERFPHEGPPEFPPPVDPRMMPPPGFPGMAEGHFPPPGRPYEWNMPPAAGGETGDRLPPPPVGMSGYDPRGYPPLPSETLYDSKPPHDGKKMKEEDDKSKNKGWDHGPGADRRSPRGWSPSQKYRGGPPEEYPPLPPPPGGEWDAFRAPAPPLPPTYGRFASEEHRRDSSSVQQSSDDSEGSGDDDDARSKRRHRKHRKRHRHHRHRKDGRPASPGADGEDSQRRRHKRRISRRDSREESSGAVAAAGGEKKSRHRHRHRRPSPGAGSNGSESPPPDKHRRHKRHRRRSRQKSSSVSSARYAGPPMPYGYGMSDTPPAHPPLPGEERRDLPPPPPPDYRWMMNPY